MTDQLATLPKDWVVTSGQFTRKAYTDVYPPIDPTAPENSLKGKVAIVTGASRGSAYRLAATRDARTVLIHDSVGAKGIAPAFAKAGAKAIVLLATNANSLRGVEEELKKINAEVEVLALSVDISSADQVAQAWSEINARYPKVHILVNNAGVATSEDAKMMHEQDPDIFFKNFVSISTQALLWPSLKQGLR